LIYGQIPQVGKKKTVPATVPASIVPALVSTFQGWVNAQVKLVVQPGDRQQYGAET
jgi:hypothetical protein